MGGKCNKIPLFFLWFCLTDLISVLSVMCGAGVNQCANIENILTVYLSCVGVKCVSVRV